MTYTQAATIVYMMNVEAPSHMCATKLHLMHDSWLHYVRKTYTVTNSVTYFQCGRGGTAEDFSLTFVCP